jgi:hypothetical protein
MQHCGLHVQAPCCPERQNYMKRAKKISLDDNSKASSLSVGVPNRRPVNLYCVFWPGWCAKRTQGCILVRAECPYVQSLLLVLLALKFVVGVTNGREREEVPSLYVWCVEWG